MTIFDYLVIFIMGCSLLISILRGLMKEVLSLLGWIVAFVVANAYGHELASMLPTLIPGAIVRLLVAFISLFIAVKMLMWLLGKTVEAMLEATGLTFADRALGSIFGLIRGALIVLTVVLLCGTTSIPKQEFWKKAYLSPLAVAGVQELMPFLPGDFTRHVEF